MLADASPGGATGPVQAATPNAKAAGKMRMSALYTLATAKAMEF
jgi:hypothetical protein